MHTAIEVRGLTKTYGGKVVVDDIDLEIATGECFALLGPNGAGKTTTLEILAGFRSRDSGTVRVLGRDPATATRAWRARIGVVGQSIGAILELTVDEALRHFAVYHGRPNDRRELLAAVGLLESSGTRIAKLSGGQRRRLDVALGVQGQPDLLFLDEPTTGMDPQGRHQFWSLIDRFRADGITIVLTTHYLDEAARLADRVGVAVHGRLVEVAAPGVLGAGLDLGAAVRWFDPDGAHQVVTPTPTKLLRELLARCPQGEIGALSVQRPTLEDVYLALLETADSVPLEQRCDRPEVLQ